MYKDKLKKIITNKYALLFLGIKTIVKMVLLLVFLTNYAFSQESAKILSVQNDFIKIIVNNMEFDKGRFSVETTGGDPTRSEDNNQPLVFGRPKPWTSYTTVRINNENYVFGGPTKKRAGKNAKYGKIISQVVTANSLASTTLINETLVEQKLSFIRNPLTKVKDTALITYTIENLGISTKNIGLRVMLDTMLGTNDGAPFRIGAKAFQSEQQFKGNQILPYWQTFDNLTSPNVIAQGALDIADLGITHPDRMVLVNWGTLADHVWSFNYQEGRSFIRAGELEKDTALAMYWQPIKVPPKGKRTIRTLYGLGGITLAPGEISLGLAAPSEISITSKAEILIVGYILNAGGFDAKNTQIHFELPKGMQIVDGQTKYTLGTIAAGESKQAAIKVTLLKNISQGDKKIILKVQSDNLEENSISRPIEIMGPPEISAKFRMPEKIIFGIDPYFDISCEITNKSRIPLLDIKVRLMLDRIIKIPDFELETKEINYLGRGETKVLNWKVKLSAKDKKEPEKKIDYAKIKQENIQILINSPLVPIKQLNKKINFEYPKQRIFLRSSEKSVQKDNYFYVEIILENAQSFKDFNAQIDYDPLLVKFVRRSFALWIKETNQEKNFIHKDQKIQIKNLKNDLHKFKREVCKFHFKAIRSGETNFILHQDGIVLDQEKVNLIRRKTK